ncbi:hypothetical protein [uncultured Chloroflexus sp.]|uniref:hypothetical protein n=1 Tax=uncultured Chloroflexus sp. TaxID=214040 RepID=UPI002604AE6B|nr:hypothetical protein [uncultured Chloroflexus sp.]
MTPRMPFIASRGWRRGRPRPSARPVVCFDKKPVQRVGETRQPLPAQPAATPAMPQ